MPKSHETPRTLRRTNEKKPLLPLVDRRGSTLDYMMVFPMYEIPPTLILIKGFEEVTSPEWIDYGLNISKES